MVNGDEISTTLVSESPEATRNAARRLGELCRGGEVLLLSGDLGTGKTCFVQGLARGLGVPGDVVVTSPTFTLHAEYIGRLVLNHADLYRLDEPAFLDGLGFGEMLNDPGAVLAAEWPEFIMPEAAGDRILVTLEHEGRDRRRLTFSAAGGRHVRLLREWRKSLGLP